MNMPRQITYIVIFIFLLIHLAATMSSLNDHSYFMDMTGPENDLAEIISAKGYLPKDSQLPKASIIKNEGVEVTYLLSKLSDEELIKLLSEQPTKHEYDLSDIAKIAAAINSEGALQNIKAKQTAAVKQNILSKLTKHKKYEAESDEHKQMGVYRLENKKVDTNSKSDSNYLAFKKLNSLLKDIPQEGLDDDDMDEEKKELLFKVLVNQLKSLCCKKTVKKQELMMPKFKSKSIVDSFSAPNIKEFNTKATEYMFLIINDEIKSNGSGELIIVDPETLQQNSSVLLLGPISTPLTDKQLTIIMNRITNELSKPEYLTLLKQLSEGTLSSDNLRLMKNFIHGSQSRRYIKPHRCNHQSKLARVYGGPKWLICTGYINLNTPSLYD